MTIKEYSELMQEHEKLKMYLYSLYGSDLNKVVTYRNEVTKN